MNKYFMFALLALFAAGPAFGGTITVSQPAGGSFAMGAACPVHWTVTGAVGNVKIQLIRPGGGLVGLLANRLAPDSSPYPWVVAAPAEAGQNYRVRVSAVDGSASGESAEFSVTAGAGPGAISNVRLSGAPPYAIGSAVTISWTAAGVSQDLKLQLLNGGGALVGAIDNNRAAGTTSHRWSAGQYIGGTAGAGDYKVRVSTVDNAVTAETTVFALTASAPPPVVYINSPSTFSSWRPGSFQNIHWNIRGSLPSLLQLTLRRDGAAESEAPVLRIADGAGSRSEDGDYTWYIPPSLAEGRYFVRARISASQVADSDVFSISASGNPGATEGNSIWINADLALVGVGVEYYNGNIVAWVKNNGPDRLRSHLVKFRVEFPESGVGRNITKELSMHVGHEEGVALMELAARLIPGTGMRVIVNIVPSDCNIRDTNRLNQHRDVRIFAD